MDTRVYLEKVALDKKYAHLNRNDLLWLMAMHNVSGVKKATFSGNVIDYSLNIEENIVDIQNKIASPDIDLMSTSVLIAKDRVYKASLDGINILIKKIVYPDVDDEIIVGVVYEALIYKHFFDYMIKNSITPNIPYYYGFELIIDDGYLQSFLYTEFMDGTDLFEYLTANEKGDGTLAIKTAKFWRPVLFQIIYTLTCFQKLNIKHNDLHLGNIYIDPDVTGTVQYNVHNDNYIVSLADCGLVKIFDMDLGSVECNAHQPSGTRNIYEFFEKDVIKHMRQLDMNGVYVTSEFNNCNNPKITNPLYKDIGINSNGKTAFDLFVSVCSLLEKHKNVFDSETRNFLANIFDERDVNRSVDEDNPYYSGFWCRSKKIGDETRDLDILLSNDYFSQLKNGIKADRVYTLPN